MSSVDICFVVGWSYAGGSGDTAANWVKIQDEVHSAAPECGQVLGMHTTPRC